MKVNISIPKIFQPLYEKLRYKLYYGGRGGGKSWAFAEAIIINALQRPNIFIACMRHIQLSIQASSYKLLIDTIQRLELDKYFRFTATDIQCVTGSKIVFRGLRGGSNLSQSIKSLEGVDICWIEEAQEVDKTALDMLVPTIRKKGSELWFTMNRYLENDPVYTHVRKQANDVKVIQKILYTDNPYLSSEILLEAKQMEKNEEELYKHVWLGEPLGAIEDSVISALALRRAMERVPTHKEYEDIAVGIDVARYGMDSTYIVIRKGATVIKYYHLEKCDSVAIATKTVELVEKIRSAKNCIFFIDDTGVGGGVVDILRHMDLEVIGINNGTSAYDKRIYADRITELWFHFSQILKYISLPNSDILYEEFVSRKYMYELRKIENTIDKVSRKKIESKDKQKKRIGRSPDFAEAVLYAYANYVPSSEMITENDKTDAPLFIPLESEKIKEQFV